MIVLTALLTSTPDPQRKTRWTCDPQAVAVLAGTVTAHQLVVFHDEPPTGPTTGMWIQVGRRHPNPYFDRWNCYRDFARHVDGQVWCVDATDVELLHDPDPVGLACGSEDDRIGWPWLAANHPTAHDLEHRHPLLNAGIVGGDARQVETVAAEIAAEANTVDLTDMAVFNRVMSRHPFVTGPTIHTRFRSEQRTHPTAAWKHK